MSGQAGPSGADRRSALLFKAPRAARLIRHLSSCTLAALLFSVSASAAGLGEQIEKLLDSSPATRNAFWGIQIVDIGTGQTLYEVNPERFFVPASNVKLFTAALALARLGPGYRFQTRVLAESAPDAEGCVHGPLVLAGGGDPNLSGRTLPYRIGSPPGNALAALEDLAAQMAARGVKRVDGEIVGDDSWYVWQPYPEGWAIDDPQYDFGAPVSALAVNDNTVTLTVEPGARAGALAQVLLDPAVEFYSIENRLKTVPAGGERRIQFERAPGGAQIRLWGSIPVRDRGQTLALGIEDPARYAALAFREALTRRGIEVTGGATARYLYPDEVENIAGTPGWSPMLPFQTGRVELARRESAPLLQDLQAMEKASINLHAEMALRAVGRARRGVGSREAGLEELRAFLGEAGIDENAYRLSDGSGLARLDLLTPAALVKLLRFMYASPMRENWMSLLPVAGQDGTLSARFGGAAAAAGRVLAKTGSMTHVSALSGYARKADGGWVAFSILANNFSGPGSEIRGVADRICNLIVE
jgi:serine-type D-Ala-D-Ala carboxypeptidase/endopeptidase (penicillin-binding protein 4)